MCPLIRHPSHHLAEPETPCLVVVSTIDRTPLGQGTDCCTCQMNARVWHHPRSTRRDDQRHHHNNAYSYCCDHKRRMKQMACHSPALDQGKCAQALCISVGCSSRSSIDRWAPRAGCPVSQTRRTGNYTLRGIPVEGLGHTVGDHPKAPARRPKEIPGHETPWPSDTIHRHRCLGLFA